MRLKMNGPVRPLHLMRTWRVLGLFYRPILDNLEMLVSWLIDLYLARCYVKSVCMPYSVMTMGWTVPGLI